MKTLIILLGMILGILSYFIGFNIDKSWNIFKKTECPNCQDAVGLKCKCGANYYLLLVFVVIIGGILTFISYNLFTSEFYVSILIILIMLSVTVSDILERIVPDRIILIGLPLMLVLRVFITTNPWYDAYIGGVIAFGVFYLIAFLGEKIYKQEVIGGGDIKLYGVIGLVLGVELTFLSIFFASFIGWVFGTIAKRVSGEVYLPFVPFISIGVFISYFYGDIILNWYFALY